MKNTSHHFQTLDNSHTSVNNNISNANPTSTLTLLELLKNVNGPCRILQKVVHFRRIQHGCDIQSESFSMKRFQ